MSAEDPRVEAAIAAADSGPLGQWNYPHSDSDYRTDVRAMLDAADAVADTVPVSREWLVRVQAYLLRVEWDAESPEPHALALEAGRFLDPGCARR